MLYYTGVGSRETPIKICHMMKEVASSLEKLGYKLRSGGAKEKVKNRHRTDIGSADKWFEKGVKNSNNKIIYTVENFDYSEPNFSMCKNELLSIFDKKGKLESYTNYVQILLIRDMNQVLGSVKTDLIKSKFLICYTKHEDYYEDDLGGTRFAVRCALKHNVPVFNLVNPEHVKRIEKIL